MTTIAWVFMGVAFAVITGAAVSSLYTILKSNK